MDRLPGFGRLTLFRKESFPGNQRNYNCSDGELLGKPEDRGSIPLGLIENVY